MLTHGDYLVFYRESSGVIEIVRVAHGRRNIPDILDELKQPAIACEFGILKIARLREPPRNR